jgi:hypothetical protein
MANTTIHDPTAHVAPSVNDDDSRHDFGVKSTAMVASSSPTHGATKIVDEEIPELTDFYKKMVMTEDDRRAYHDHG